MNQKIVVLFLIFLAELLFLVQVRLVGDPNSFLASVVPEALVGLTNQARIPSNLPPLRINPLLTMAAELKAADMVQRKYFTHISPAGQTPWAWLEKVGYRYEYAGENLAVNFTDSREVVRAWLASANHRANIVNPRYDETGVAIARGEYRGRPAVFVVQFLGRRANPASVTSRLQLTAATGAAVTTWFTSPKTLNLVILATLALLLVFLLIFEIFWRFKQKPTKTIVLGIGLLLLIIFVLWLNQSYLTPPLQIGLR